MCAKQRARAVKAWWGQSSFIQSQLATITTIVFLGGAAFNALSNVKSDVGEIRAEQKPLIILLHQIDKNSEVNSARISNLEKEEHHKHTNSTSAN